jgi:Protein of unknown function (DUF3987)
MEPPYGFEDVTALRSKGADSGNWPTPAPLPDGLPPVELFNPDLLPADLRDGIMDIAERLQCPPDFPAATTIVALGAVIGRQLGIRPKRLDDWLVVPNLWGAVVGRPGVMKSPAIEEPLRPMRGLEAAAAEQFDKALKDYKAGGMVSAAAEKIAAANVHELMKRGKHDEAKAHAAQHVRETAEAPARRRFMLNDSTIEKMGEVLSKNPNGVLVFRDELTGLLRTLDREGQEGSRAFFLEAWNGTGRFTYDRIARGTIEIEACCVSVFGGIQPGPLAAYMSGAMYGGGGDDGLLQRFQVMVWPDIDREWHNVDRQPFCDARRKAAQTFNRLANIDAAAICATVHEDAAIPYLRFDPDAQSVFDEWRLDLEGKVRSGNEHAAIEAHLSKYRSLIPSLALILHLAEGGTGPVPVPCIVRAAAWGEYLESHARRVYSMAVAPAVTSARALAARIKAGELKVAGEAVDTFTARDVYRSGWTSLTEPDDTRNAIDVLCEFDWLRPEKVNSGGRQKVIFRINPLVRTAA